MDQLLKSKCICVFRLVVLRPDCDPASAGDHLWVRAWSGKWGAELHELSNGPAPFYHGDFCSTTSALWHPCYHICNIHHHRAQYVFLVRTQSQEKTPPRNIRRRHSLDISTGSTLHLGNECLPSDLWLQHSVRDLAIHYNTSHLISCVQLKEQHETSSPIFSTS